MDSDQTGSKPVLNILSQLGTAHPTVTVLAGDSVGRTVVLDVEELIIGRSHECHIRIDDDGVSRSHARLSVSAERVAVEDLQSKNGTLVNGERINALTTLKNGDKIQLGPAAVLRFAYQDLLEAEAQKKLFDQATRDVLTGLYNRAYLTEVLTKEFAFADRHGHALAVMLLDVDHFKRVNDTLGHSGGDAVLRALSDVLLKTIRIEDTLGRYGGEEFLVVARELTPARAVAFAERLRKVVSKHDFVVAGQKVPVTLSIGVVTNKKAKFLDWRAMVDAADHALYEAKQNGRNQVMPPPTGSKKK
ncbi:MAG: GGDEF domain-containing protein [Archangium sp.]|nr:GGDEF domain-containing protein [Archangium sp.]